MIGFTLPLYGEAKNTASCSYAASSFYPGSLNGALSTLSLQDLCSVVIKDVLKRAAVKPEEVSEVIMGHVLTAGESSGNHQDESVGRGPLFWCHGNSCWAMCI